jgi:hypothetical protein
MAGEVEQNHTAAGQGQQTPACTCRPPLRAGIGAVYHCSVHGYFAKAARIAELEAEVERLSEALRNVAALAHGTLADYDPDDIA